MDLSKHLEKAEDAVKRRNYALAIKVYGQLLGLQPDFGPARAGLRKALFKKAETKPPSKLFAILGGAPSLLIAKVSKLFKAHGAAAKSYERYLALDPLSESVNLALGESLEKAGFGQSALAVYRTFAEQDARCLAAARRAGQLLYDAGEHQDALGMFEQALKIDPRDQDSLRARKNLAAEGALKSSGLETADSARELAKDQGELRRQERRDRLQLSPEEIEAETAELEEMLGAAPDHIGHLARLGQLHEMRDDQQSALDVYERVIQLDPDRSEIAAKAGDLRLSLQEQRVREAEARGDHDAAKRAQRALDEARVVEYRRRVGQHPTDLGLRFELGQGLLGVEAYDDAIAELQQAVKDPRRRTEALWTLGRAFRGKGLDELAQSQLVKALEATGGVGGKLGKEIAYELAGVAEGLGETETALGHYQTILESDIGFRDVDDKVQRLRAAQ